MTIRVVREWTVLHEQPAPPPGSLEMAILELLRDFPGASVVVTR